MTSVKYSHLLTPIESDYIKNNLKAFVKVTTNYYFITK